MNVGPNGNVRSLNGDTRFDDIHRERESKKPSKMEVLAEAVRPVKEFGLGFGLSAAMVNIIPYAIPTAKRFFKDDSEEELSPSHIAGAHTGGIIGASLGYCAHIAGYVYASVPEGLDSSEVLLIPVATNLASGAYEIGRSIYKNAEKRLTEK